MNKTYTCDACRGVFDQGWTDEEAETEFAAIFGREKTDDDAEICDDCYKQIMGLST